MAVIREDGTIAFCWLKCVVSLQALSNRTRQVKKRVLLPEACGMSSILAHNVWLKYYTGQHFWITIASPGLNGGRREMDKLKFFSIFLQEVGRARNPARARATDDATHT